LTFAWFTVLAIQGGGDFTNVSEAMEKLESCAFVVGVQNDATAIENSFFDCIGVLQRVKCKINT
jgi:hypothetical protein